VNVAAVRLARQAVRAVLHRDGWTLLHARAVVRDGRAVLTFGSKGAGKTTTALLLARHCGWELLASDRIFVRADPGGVQILPWPAAAAIGLLDALGPLRPGR
jgi:serine kinase of HPr protein (carbohydrate metabolism regulator)